MAKKRYTAEQIINKLREAEVELAKGHPFQARGRLQHERHPGRLR
ncbi:MAG: hypothetical protein ACYTF1_21620 [Planctomycetota bacterium]|jgi:hypothetical protein